jgi:hypothetical protein
VGEGGQLRGVGWRRRKGRRGRLVQSCRGRSWGQRRCGHGDVAVGVHVPWLGRGLKEDEGCPELKG